MAFKVTTLRLSRETVKTVEDLLKKLQRKKSEVTREALQIGTYLDEHNCEFFRA